MANFKESEIDFFKKSTFVWCENVTSPQKYLNYQTNEFIWQLHIGFFFHVKIQIIDDFNDEFLICK